MSDHTSQVWSEVSFEPIICICLDFIPLNLHRTEKIATSAEIGTLCHVHTVLRKKNAHCFVC